MKKTVIIAFSALALAGASACRGKKDNPPKGTPTKPAPNAPLPPADGAGLLEYITKTSPYKTWKPLPAQFIPEGVKTDYLLPGSYRFFNGQIARAYVNDFGEGTVLSKAAPHAPGTVIVVERWVPKEDGSIGPEDSPDNIIVQLKSPGVDPEHKDWFFMSVKGGAVDKAGADAKACADCHALLPPEADFVFTTSGKMSLLAAPAPGVKDKGDAFVKSLLSGPPEGLHYTHYDSIPADKRGAVIPASTKITDGIEWFNGKLEARVFANPLAQNTIAAGEKKFPAGSLLIAEQYEKNADGTVNPTPFAVVAQVKVEGADPKHGDWVWLSYSLRDKKVLTFGKDAKACIECHTKIAENDFVWTTSGKRPPAAK
jgi:hypothetical protein